MGRKRNIYLREFFDYNSEKNASICKICGLEQSGSYICNLKRHMIKNHVEVYEKGELENIDPEINPVTQKKMKFSVKFSPEEVKSACVNLVTKESQPFAILDCDAFKLLTTQIFKGLNMPRISSHNIMNFVTERYEILKETIINVCKGKLLCLKMDTATRLDRSVLGINLQIIKKDSIEIYTLAIKELLGRHTGVNLKEQLEKVLEEFEIDKKQIYCITTDNGRNMLKAVEAFSIEDSNEVIDEETIHSEKSTQTFIDDLCKEEEDIISIKCAAHTLQLAVKDFLATMESEVISRARELVKNLRTPTIRCSLQLLNLRKPRLDVVTRWNSTYDMLHRLLEYEEFCKAKFTSLVTEEDWITIKNIVQVLEPVYITTMQLQESQLLFGDFYKLWINLRYKLINMKTSTAENLLKCLETRESQLLQHDIWHAAIFLDPRIKRLLSTNQKEIAKKHLKSIAKRMVTLNQNTTVIDESEAQDSNLTIDSADLLNISIAGQSSNNAIVTFELDSSTDDESVDENLSKLQQAYLEIDRYKPKRVDPDIDLMTYWQGERFKTPYLSELAKLVHAVPATQVSVERSFSSLKLIMSDRRYNLLGSNIEKLLFVKLNDK